MVGYINGYDREQGVISIIVPDFYDYDLLMKQDITECDVILQDGRTITAKQNRAIHAMSRDIAAFISGYAEKPEVRNETLHALQMAYLMDTESKEEVRYALTNHYCELNGIELFSLSSRSPNAASMTLAHDFLSWLIDFAIENGIPCSGNLIDRAEDIQRYLYACVMNKRCAVCGNPSDLHHVDRIGTGRDRRTAIHVGARVQSLCREHHQEAHTIGQKTFDEKYHLQSITCNEEICKFYGLKYIVE